MMPESDFKTNATQVIDNIDAMKKNGWTDGMKDSAIGALTEAHKAFLASEREKIRKWAEENYTVYAASSDRLDGLIMLTELQDFLSSLDKESK